MSLILLIVLILVTWAILAVPLAMAVGKFSRANERDAAPQQTENVLLRH